MDWEALVQSLCEIIDQNGFAVFEKRLRAAMPDQPVDALIYTLECLQTFDNKTAIQPLLLEFIRNSRHSDQIKHRLQMALRFELSEPNQSAYVGDHSKFLEEIYALTMKGRFTDAVDKIQTNIALPQNSCLLELLGRVVLLKNAHEAHVAPYDAAEAAKPNIYTEIKSVKWEGESDLLTWVDSENIQIFTHDDECRLAAKELQENISNSTAVDPTSIEWEINIEDWMEPVPITLEEVAPKLEPTNRLQSASVPTVSISNEIQEKQLSPDEIDQATQSSQLEFELIKLQAEDKQLLKIILANPKIYSDQLARVVHIRPPVLNHILGIRLKYWIERDRLGGFSIKSELLNLLPDLAFETSNSSESKPKPPTKLLEYVHRNQETVDTSIFDTSMLSEQARQILEFFIQNPGTKSYRAAEILKISHMTLLSLLSGCLDDFLEKDRSFSITPRPSTTEPPSKEEDNIKNPLAHPQTITNTVQVLHEDNLVQIRNRLALTAYEIRKLAGTDLDQATSFAPTDLGKAADLYRLPTLGKRILALLASCGKGYSRELARELGQDVDDINKMLLNKLGDYVSVTHSVWRLNDGVIEALKVAKIK